MQLMLSVTVHTESVVSTTFQQQCCDSAMQQLQTRNIVHARG